MEELSAPPSAQDPSPPARPGGPGSQVNRLKRWYTVVLRALHRTLFSVIDHDCLNVAQSTAYSAIVALFPALIVAAAVIGLLPDTAPVRFQLAAFFDRVLPPGVSPLLDAAFEITPQHAHSVRALVSAGFVSFLGATNVIATLMEGFRRARELPPDCWSFWERRRRTFELVPLCSGSARRVERFDHLRPYGNRMAGVQHWSRGARTDLRCHWLTRWVVALGASVGLIALIYHLGVPAAGGVRLAHAGDDDSREIHRRSMRSETKSALFETLTPQTWRAILPGAVMATAMWFLTTLIFGLYVTRFANYSEVYGSLGAGIALLFWLYIVSLSVLCGAEFNAQFENQFQVYFGRRQSAPPPVSDMDQSLADREGVARGKSSIQARTPPP